MRSYKKPGPVVYIDPGTGLPKCTPETCVDKLEQFFEIKETNYKWVGGPVIHKLHYSICNDCKTRTITNKDKKQTDDSYKRAIQNDGYDPNIKEQISGGQET